NCRFPDVERAAASLAPRPWLAIHGARDAYIGPEIARTLFAEAGEPKELWVVPDAKHNRCREVAPDEYAARLGAFLARFAPRRSLAEVDAAAADPASEVLDVPDRPVAPAGREIPSPALAGGLAAPVAG